ncbi:MAG: 30S ribosomal protein S5 [Candidatus Anstonellales archaeon]
MDEKNDEKDEKTQILESWEPKTEVGRLVKEGKITSIEEIYKLGKPVLETQVIELLLSDLKEETLEIKSTQRVTDCGRKAQFRTVVLVGDGKGHLGIGAGKSEEVKPAIESAINDAKRNIICVPFGSGSWEDRGEYYNSIPVRCVGKCGSVKVELQPAPRGLGQVGNRIIRTILQYAGIKDVWSRASGNTSNIYNTAMAVLYALESLNTMRGARWPQYPNPRHKRVKI